MDDIDDMIYETLKSNFETLLSQCVSNYQSQNITEGQKQYDVLIKLFNDGVDSRKKMMKKIHKQGA